MPRASRLLAGWFVLSLTCGPAWGAGQCRAPESLTSFGTWFEPQAELTADFPDQPVRAANWVPDARTMRLLLQVRAGTDRHWHLVVRDESYRVLATLYPDDFAAADGTLTLGRWTGRLPTASVRIDLANAAPDLRVGVTGAIAMPAGSHDERQFSTQHAVPAWQDLYGGTPISARRAGDAVGMLLGGQFDPATGQHQSWCCTGVMVGNELMLTNWHCGGTAATRTESFWNKDVCANTIFDLGWDSGAVSRQYACSEVVAKDQRLDIALIRVRPVVGTGSGADRTPVAPIAEHAAAEAVFLIHHALCRPKLYSGACRVKAASYPNWIDPAAATDFTHDCDTEPGASGAPVFDASGHLVGLHHLGFACAPPDQVNKAVKISEIMAFLAANAPDAAAEIARQ